MFVPHDMILQPTSSEADPIWVANPKIRSTFDLVSSCILTLILCVWTAIHLNVPGYQEREAKGMLKWWKPIQKRILWMCVGLVAPEVVLYIAWQQYLQARFICEGMSKIEEIKPER